MLESRTEKRSSAPAKAAAAQPPGWGERAGGSGHSPAPLLHPVTAEDEAALCHGKSPRAAGAGGKKKKLKKIAFQLVHFS